LDPASGKSKFRNAPDPAEQAFPGLPQFTSPDARRCLRDVLPDDSVYPAGRLDYDSEGLMLLTDFGPWQARIIQPGGAWEKRYLVQVEGTTPSEPALPTLRRIRIAVGPWNLDGPGPGEWREIPLAEAEAALTDGRVRPSARAPRSASRVRGPARR
jgi:23S rRNA pseudouridine2457 synthase